MRILVIEDDRQTREFLVHGLTQSGHVVDSAAEGKDGLFLALDQQYDAMVIDRMLPGLEGLSIIETVRKSGDPTPILVLSALGEVDDRVEGLQRGGDDYLVKPFAFSELEARLEALVRRGTQPLRSDWGSLDVVGLASERGWHSGGGYFGQHDRHSRGGVHPDEWG